ncbi:MAG: cytochrome-c peroxidase [Methylococcales bacterium]|nr:cytochrome-c peroxidase [Methylococcales bacterium]
MRVSKIVLLSGGLLLSQVSIAHGPLPVSLKGAPIPPVPGLTDGSDPVVVDKNMAIALGKALFWDINVGSDGVACASCHFHAGADSRVRNQLNPGFNSPKASGKTFEKTASGGTGGANYTLNKRDFPAHQFKDPFDKLSEVIFDSDDVVSSAGTFNADFGSVTRIGSLLDNCSSTADAVFHVGSINTRQVAARNTPSVINAVFYYRNFWDGRANNIFNGSNNWGDRDPNAGVWVKTANNTVVKERLQLINSSLASQAVAPPLNDVEMSCKQRTFPALARKLLMRRPLENQIVHPNDSVLSVLSFKGNAQRGLNTRYKAMITKAFNQKYWSYNSGIGLFGGAVEQAPYTQMEANFTLFFGVSLQLYMSTLISDDAPFDRATRDANSRPIGLSPEAQKGFTLFEDSHCNICHAGPALTSAAIVTNAMMVEANPNAFGSSTAASEGGISRNVINHDAMLNFVNRFMDVGFFNTGVTDVNGDPGVGGLDPLGNPLAFTDQYLAYLAGNSSKVVDKNVGIATVRSCDFLKPLARQFNADETRTGLGNYFNSDEPGTIMADPNGNKNCVNRLYGTKSAYIPTQNAAAIALADPATRRMAKATQGAFKVPTLRNIALTSPYMHNGGMATLEQVITFYSRATNFDSDFKHSFLIPTSTLQADKEARANLIAFLNTLTDERVVYEKAPFDHPELIIGHGHPGNNTQVTTGNFIAPNVATDALVTLPAVGAEGTTTPQQNFENNLAD